MNPTQRSIVQVALALMPDVTDRECSSSQQLARVVEGLGSAATHFRLARDPVDPGLVSLEAHLVTCGLLARGELAYSDWSSAAVFSPLKALDKVIDSYIDLLVLIHHLACLANLRGVDLDQLALAKISGAGATQWGA